MFSDTPGPRPVLGLLLIGGALILIEGVFGVVLASRFPGQSLVLYGDPVAAIVLAVLIFVFTAITAGEGPLAGWLFIALGALSLFVGGGFLVGGIFVVLAGALGIFADWTEELVRLRLEGHGLTVITTDANGGGDTASVGGAATTGPGGLPPPTRSTAPAAARCRSCGVLNPAGRVQCVPCGRVLDT